MDDIDAGRELEELAARWSELPTPDDAKLSAPGLAFASAIRLHRPDRQGGIDDQDVLVLRSG